MIQNHDPESHDYLRDRTKDADAQIDLVRRVSEPESEAIKPEDIFTHPHIV